MSGMKVTTISPYQRKIDSYRREQGKKKISRIEGEIKTFNQKYNVVFKYDSTVLNKLCLSMNQYSYEKIFKKINNEISSIEKKLRKNTLCLNEINHSVNLYKNQIEALAKDERLKEDLKTLEQLIYNTSYEKKISEREKSLSLLEKGIERCKQKYLNLGIKDFETKKAEEIFEEENRAEKLKDELSLVLEKILFLEPNYRFDFDLNQEGSRLELLKDELKVSYAQIRKAKLLKEELLDSIREIDDPNLNAKVHHFVKKISFTQKEYEILKEEIKAFEEMQESLHASEWMSNNVIEGLEALGYEIVEEKMEQLKAYEEVLLDVEADYKLRVTLKEEGGYKIRFIKHVFDKNEPSQSEEQRDLEMMTKWCDDYQRFTKLLSDNGLNVEHKIKLEPDMDDIEYILVKREETGKENVQNTVQHQSR